MCLSVFAKRIAGTANGDKNQNGSQLSWQTMCTADNKFKIKSIFISIILMKSMIYCIAHFVVIRHWLKRIPVRFNCRATKILPWRSFFPNVWPSFSSFGEFKSPSQIRHSAKFCGGKLRELVKFELSLLQRNLGFLFRNLQIHSHRLNKAISRMFTYKTICILSHVVSNRARILLMDVSVSGSLYKC
jgi:hypothetical protein